METMYIHSLLIKERRKGENKWKTKFN
jgi:hypothetical protein